MLTASWPRRKPPPLQGSELSSALSLRLLTDARLPTRWLSRSKKSPKTLAKALDKVRGLRYYVNVKRKTGRCSDQRADRFRRKLAWGRKNFNTTHKKSQEAIGERSFFHGKRFMQKFTKYSKKMLATIQ